MKKIISKMRSLSIYKEEALFISIRPLAAVPFI